MELTREYFQAQGKLGGRTGWRNNRAKRLAQLARARKIREAKARAKRKLAA